MNEMQRKARTRKALYVATILGLFTLSLIWRGEIPIPFTNALAARDRVAKKEPLSLGDRLTMLPVLAQAETLELREVDQGDPNIATSAAQYSLLGFRGPIVTGLWWAAIEKQKRNEWHEFEKLVGIVTHLQPKFITPWIFQSWNIAYNVSVENDKLGDMYFYIARGIELLAEGDRLNTSWYRPPGETPIKIGSPDIRYQIGFYYQNKFGVSDKVNTLRSLMQLSCMKPSERDPDSLLRDGQVNLEEFAKFCRANPQLVRRLRTKLKCDSPRDVIDFLRMNTNVPTRYTPDGGLKSAETQFPILPNDANQSIYGASLKETYQPDSVTTDSFDAFHAAREWFNYAQIIIPPPPPGEPSALPRDYDKFRYRLPQKPALVVFRMSPPRAQHYLAERLTKEGWFTRDTEWDPDVGSDNPWFPRLGDSTVETPRLKSTANAQAEWATAYGMWREYGNLNGLHEENLSRFSILSAEATMFPPGQLPPPESDFSPDELRRLFSKRDPLQSDEDFLQRCRDVIHARRAMVLYAQNVQITNFPYFLSSSEAEMNQSLVEARRLVYESDVALRLGAADRRKALRLLVQALVKWRDVCAQFPNSYHSNDLIQEQIYETQNQIITALKQDAQFTRSVETTRTALTAVVPEAMIDDLKHALAEIESQVRIAHAIQAPQYLARMQNVKEGMSGIVGPWVLTDDPDPDRVPLIGRALIATEFSWMKEFMNEQRLVYFIRPAIRENVKIRLGIIKPAAPETPAEVLGPDGKPLTPQETISSP